MKLHANARTCPKSRLVMVRRFLAGRPRENLAAEFAVSTRTVSKWVARYRAEGEAGTAGSLFSAATGASHRCGSRRGDRRVAQVADDWATEIAELLGPASSRRPRRCSARIGMGRLGRIGLEPARRYERERPGELIHIDINKLGRIQGGAGKRITGAGQHYNRTFTDAAGRCQRTVGWDFVHVAVDDATRLAYAEVLLRRTSHQRDGISRSGRSAGSPATASPSSASSPTTAPPTSRPCTRSRAARSASATSAPAPGGRRPTAKPNASSAPCWAAGPTAARPTAHPPNAAPPLTAGLN